MRGLGHEIFLFVLMVLAVVMAIVLAIDVLQSKTSPTTACPVRIELVHIR